MSQALPLTGPAAAGWRRVAVHVLWWLVPLLVEYYFVGRLFKDTAPLHLLATSVLLLQTVGVYYWLGYYLFPRYLYQPHPLRLLAHALLVFYVVYLVNYGLFYALQPLSKGFGSPEVSYAERTWEKMLRPAGLLGCFTSLRVAFWNYGFGPFVATVLLCIKFVRDITIYQTKNLRLERDRIALERNNLMLELDFLKSQINPHFLFNTLNSIYVQVVDSHEAVAEQVLQLSNLMRYGLYESNTSRVELARELDYIHSYLQLEKSRYGAQVDIQFVRDDGTATFCIAPLLLISFVENAFKHGVGRVKAGSYVHVQALMHGTELTFTVVNRLPATAAAAGVGGVGLSNVRKRLELLYPDRHQLTVDADAAAEQYAVHLTLELEPLAAGR
ncbi:sensor histidine kinase [Hymenobacter edaphi]|uniref:Signal transduction histidine kinase internal region domain-containing protein n=1 Tax=Hymenobacter edaphi TaxID=2211146 RepID=A0A328BLR6_9BACT|nr:sensor histidine kinase [Hymenobacter edaphi]RAK68053.1 hypothetical protein DLM85_08405 [Hymenobacter edaphi]